MFSSECFPRDSRNFSYSGFGELSPAVRGNLRRLIYYQGQIRADALGHILVVVQLISVLVCLRISNPGIPIPALFVVIPIPIPNPAKNGIITSLVQSSVARFARKCLFKFLCQFSSCLAV